MYCINCIKRLFFKQYIRESEEEYISLRPIKTQTNVPLTTDKLYETSMFKKISDWSIKEDGD